MEPSRYKSSNCFSTDVCHPPMGVSLHSPWVPAEGPWRKRGPGALTGCCTHRASREGGETSCTGSEASHSSFKGSPPGFVLRFLVAKKFWKSKQYNIHHVHFGHIGKSSLKEWKSATWNVAPASCSTVCLYWFSVLGFTGPPAQDRGVSTQQRLGLLLWACSLSTRSWPASLFPTPYCFKTSTSN